MPTHAADFIRPMLNRRRKGVGVCCHICIDKTISYRLTYPVGGALFKYAIVASTDRKAISTVLETHIPLFYCSE
jgi:hypothetical protein